MERGFTTALIVGIDHMVAQKLAAFLLEKELMVIGVGENGGEMIGKNKFQIVTELGEVEDKVTYVFDFTGSENAWAKALKDGAKLAVVVIDNNIVAIEIEKGLKKYEGDWRLVEMNLVYGPGMDLESNWLGRVIEQAVLNRPLTVPQNEMVRPLAVEDVVEVLLRACFLSGTTEEHFIYGGALIERNEVEKVLVKEAKMTREGVEIGKFEEEVSSEEIEKSWQKLRWVPMRAFGETITETLQYFFTIADTLGRKKSASLGVPLKENLKRGYFEVVESENDQAIKPVDTGSSLVKEEVVEVDKVQIDESVQPKVESPKVELENTKDDKEIKKKEKVEEIPKLSWVKPVSPVIISHGLTDRVEDDEEELIEESQAIMPVSTGTSPVSQVIMPVETGTNLVKKVPKVGNIKYKWIIGIILGILGISLLAGGIKVWQLARGINAIGNDIKKQDWKKAESNSIKRLAEIRSIEETLTGVGIRGDVYQMLRVIDQGLVVIKEVVPIMEQGQLLYEGVLKDREIDSEAVTKNINQQLSVVIPEMGILQARMEGEWKGLPGVVKETMTLNSKKIEDWRLRLDKVKTMLTILPEFLGSNGQRRDWMFLFQNEQELRPTGGFIGSFGIMSFENGKLLNLDVRDIYAADGQLKGHVEPPWPIKDYLGEAGWYMRDSNWQPSLPLASKDILWFLDKETGRSVNGIVAINLAVARGILGVVGELYLVDFKEKINKDNLYEQAEFYSEQKFFPGSHEKANFLGALSKQLFEEIKGLSIEKQLDLVSVLIDLADRNELQIAANDKNTAKVLANLGWDGSMYEGGCGKESCSADYLYIVEANVGVNKVNYFIRRNIEQMVEITSNLLHRVVKINYENTAKSASWPGGDYKNYVRIYVPGDVVVTSVTTYDTNNPTDKTEIDSSNLKVNKVGNKNEISFLVTVGVKKRLTVELQYGSLIDLSKGDKYSYLGYIQRQSGYGDTGIVSLVSYPEEWQVLQVEPSASMVGNKLLFNQKLDRDIKMGVEIGK